MFKITRTALRRMLTGTICMAGLLWNGVAAGPADYAVILQATVQDQPFAIRLQWVKDPAATAYEISRKTAEEEGWTPLARLDANQTAYLDGSVVPGKTFEYKVVKEAGPDLRGFGYIMAGGGIPMSENRGTVLLLVESSVAPHLQTELSRFEFDLVGDGWNVLRQEVSATVPPAQVKEMIREFYQTHPSLNTLLLIGHVPVPYSGNFAPDEHPNHVGAWPADGYYADLDGVWTDESVDTTTAEKKWNWNIPGDGKFDQSVIPSEVELQVGRVDLSRMTCFSNKVPPRSEVDLLRQYFEKNHRFRHGKIRPDRRALVFDKIGMSKPEPLTTHAWRNFPVMVGTNMTVISDGQFFPVTGTNSFLWSAVASGGAYTMSDNVGSSDSFALNTVNVVFSMFTGSYFGDWDNESNFLRAVIGASGMTLASMFSGQPQWICHPMALGATLGYATKLTMENGPEGIYLPHNTGAGMVHIALHGDPTLRAFPIRPVSGLRGEASESGMKLQWSAPDGEELRGYYVYKGSSRKGLYTRLTPKLIGTTEFIDSEFREGETYMVKAVALTTTPSGSFWNSSQGTFFPNPFEELSTTTPPEPPTSLSVIRTSGGSITLQWVAGSANHAGYILERRLPGETQFTAKATLAPETTTYTDTGLSGGGTYEYRLKAFNKVGDSGYSNVATAAIQSSSATYLFTDGYTRGDWRGVYGAEGYDLFQSGAHLPNYVTMDVRGAQLYSGGMTDDVRALIRDNSDERWLTCWAGFNTISFDLRFLDDQVHQVAIYSVDWQKIGRGFTCEIIDSFTGQRLDSRRFSELSEGIYLVYALRGQVTLRFTSTSTTKNIGLFGIFFDPPKVSTPHILPETGIFNGKVQVRFDRLTSGAEYRYTLDGSLPTSSSTVYSGPFWIYSDAQIRVRGSKPGFPDSSVASADLVNGTISRAGFLKMDDSTSGSWAPTYGQEGLIIAQGTRALPWYAEVRVSGSSEWLWKDSTSDPRALIKSAGAADRLATCWYSTSAMEVEIGIFDTKAHAVGLYFLDWDNLGRVQRVEVLNPQGEAVAEYTLRNFSKGVYLVLNLQGYWRIRISRQEGSNAVLSGIFFDASPTPLGPPPKPAPLVQPELIAGALQVQFSGEPGHRVCLDQSTDLVTWSCIQTNIFSGTNLNLSAPRNDSPWSFYRVHFVE